MIVGAAMDAQLRWRVARRIWTISIYTVIAAAVTSRGASVTCDEWNLSTLKEVGGGGLNIDIDTNYYHKTNINEPVSQLSLEDVPNKTEETLN